MGSRGQVGGPRAPSHSLEGPCRPCPPEAVSAQVLCDFPHTAGAIPADYLLDLIPPIRPRAFSIASSLLVRPTGQGPELALGMLGRLQAGVWGAGDPVPPRLPHIWAQPSGEWVELEARADGGQESPMEPAASVPSLRLAHPGCRSSWLWCSTRHASRSAAGASAPPGWPRWIRGKVTPVFWRGVQRTGPGASVLPCPARPVPG